MRNKELVATSAAQLASVESIQARAQANGVLDLQWLSRDEALALEPAGRSGCVRTRGTVKPASNRLCNATRANSGVPANRTLMGGKKEGGRRKDGVWEWITLSHARYQREAVRR